MDSIIIASAVRTAIGRYGGTLKDVEASMLATRVIQESVVRAGITPEQVDEVILGEVRQTTMASNVARVAALRAGIPESSPAFSINRLCASGMQAIASGVQQIMSGQAEIVIAGGTENMSQAPIYLRGSRFGGDAAVLVDSNKENGQQPKEIYGEHLGMGITAENVAEKYGITREDQDAFAIESQQRTARAVNQQLFEEEIATVEVPNKKGSVTFKTDEHPRPESTYEKLSQLKPAFRKSGTVTAGNACGRNDGAAAVVLMRESKAKELGITPLARITDWAAAGVSPEIMGIGPVPAVRKLLERTGKSIEDVDLFEVNEAFASQALAVIRELGLDSSKVNVNGGAIALGHPLGATGARITVSLLHEMKRSGKKTGISTLCIGGGQGMALMLELV